MNEHDERASDPVETPHEAVPSGPSIASGSLGQGHTHAPPGSFKVLFTRAFNAELDPGTLLPDEVSAIEVERIHGGSEPLKRVLLWRRGAILAALVFLIPSTFVHLIRDFVAIARGGVGGSVAGLTLVGTLAGIGLCFGAYAAFKRWDNWARSRKILFWTWAIAFLTPFVLSLVPYSVFGGGMQERLGGFLAVLTLAPKALSLVPGLLRAALTTKTMFPGSPTPGWLILLGTPFYMLLLLIVMLTPYHLAGGGLMALALFCFLGAPIFLIRAGRRLATAAEIGPTLETIRTTRMATMALNGAGALFLFIGLIDVVTTLQMNPLDAVTPLFAVVANVFVLGVIGVDTLLVAMTRAHVPHESPDEARARQAYLRDMNAFIAAASEAQPDVVSREQSHIDYDQPTERGTRKLAVSPSAAAAGKPPEPPA